MRFVVATRHYAGLGFALRLQEEGHEVLLAVAGTEDRRLEDRYALVGNGMIPKQALADAVEARAGLRDAYWIWDENHSVEANELLRREGFKVFGGGTYPDTMEHDRDACLTLVGRYGLKPPPSHPFADATSALALLEEQPETAFVYKPDVGETHETWLPQSESAGGGESRASPALADAEESRALRPPGAQGWCRDQRRGVVRRWRAEVCLHGPRVEAQAHRRPR